MKFRSSPTNRSRTKAKISGVLEKEGNFSYVQKPIQAVPRLNWAFRYRYPQLDFRISLQISKWDSTLDTV